MLTTISAEFIKLKRSSIVWLILLGGFVPPIIKAIQYATPQTLIGNGKWSGFLSTNQEINMFITLTVMIIASAFIFSMEYQYDTASYIFTTTTSRVQIYIAKILSLLLQVSGMLFVNALAQLLLGFMVVPEPISEMMLSMWLLSTGWNISSYFLLSILVSTVAIITRRFIISTAVVYGYMVITFPIHYFLHNPYINPLMSSVVVVAKIYNSNGYIFGSYYPNIQVNILDIVLLLIALALIFMIVSIIYYKKSDPIM
jgi:ABC-type transport system involved in multi-copper enzyme maturation permease subunit